MALCDSKRRSSCVVPGDCPHATLGASALSHGPLTCALACCRRPAAEAAGQQHASLMLLAHARAGQPAMICSVQNPAGADDRQALGHAPLHASGPSLGRPEVRRRSAPCGAEAGTQGGPASQSVAQKINRLALRRKVERERGRTARARVWLSRGRSEEKAPTAKHGSMRPSRCGLLPCTCGDSKGPTGRAQASSRHSASAADAVLGSASSAASRCARPARGTACRDA